MHVDDFLDTPSIDEKEPIHYAKWVLDYFRMPAWKKIEFRPFMKDNKLFCTYKGTRYRCIGASRMGDVWLTGNFDAENGYEHRVELDYCTLWSAEP